MSFALVISTNSIAKFFCNWILTGKVIIKVIKGWVKRGKGDFSLITTHVKFDISKSGAGKGLCLPMKSIAIRTYNTYIIKVMNLPRWIKRPTCDRKMNDDKLIV